MNQHVRVALAALCAAATLPLLPAPAHAGTRQVTATSPRCGTLTLSIRDLGGLGEVDLQAGVDGLDGTVGNTPRSRTWRNLPSGLYTWKLVYTGGGMTGATRVVESGAVTVRPCSSTWPRKPVNGDLDHDGRGDLLTVTISGDLMRYRSRGTSLANGTRIGWGWGSTVFAQRTLVGSRPVVLAIRSDGTLWRYPVTSAGTLGTGTRIAKGLQGYDHYLVTPDTTEGHGVPEVWGIRKGTWTSFGYATATGFTWKVDRDAGPLHAPLDGGWGSPTLPLPVRAVTSARMVRPYSNSAVFAVRPDGSLLSCSFTWADPYNGTSDYEMNGSACSPAGHGWGAMALVSSPGSVDGDPYDDVVARRSDGNLYLYRVTNGRLGTAQQVGSRWQGVRLVF